MTATHVLQWRLPTRADKQTAWRLLRETDTFNRVAGMGLRFTEKRMADGTVKRIGKISRFGLKLPWLEKPYQYQEPDSWSTERVFLAGPVDRYVVTMDLEATDTGTTIHYRVEFWPRRPILMQVVKVDANNLVKPKLDATLKRAVKFLNGELTEFDISPPPLSKRVRARLASGLLSVESAQVARLLAAYISDAPLARQNMMHPLKLARVWKLAPAEVIKGFFQAVSAGLMSMHWQLMCPSCRMPKVDFEMLSLDGKKPHCAACNVSYDGSLPDSIAVSFRPDKSIRKIDLPIECLGSPGRSPSIVAQIELQPNECRAWSVPLLPGSYRIRSWPNLEVASLQVRRDVDGHLLTIVIGPAAIQPPLLRVASGAAKIALRNRMGVPVRLAIQRRSLDDRLLTAGRLLEIPDVASWLPNGAMSPHLLTEIVHRAVVAVSVQRGGENARNNVRQSFRKHAPSAMYAADDLVIAAFSSVDLALKACESVQGARHLATGITVGPITLLKEGHNRIPNGHVVEYATQLARTAAGGGLLTDEAGASVELDGALEASLGVSLETRTDGLRSLLFTARTEEPLIYVESSEPSEGDLIDERFRVGKLVGSGGFGAVFAAHDEHNDEEVVVKVLRPRFANDNVQVQRFFNEGHITALLDSPYIARTVEFGLGIDGRLYIAMERLRGYELADEMRQAGVVDPQRAIAVCRDTLYGLQAAHDAGLIHRDIKPGNIFVCEDGDVAVKVIDFGIALVADKHARSESEGRTAIGTPSYMSPEQAQASLDIDERSDIYSVGVVLYEALTGKYPFSAKTALGVLLARIREDPIPLQTVVEQTLPDGLAEFVMRCLSREPAGRFNSANAAVDELTRVSTGKFVPFRRKPDVSAVTASSKPVKSPPTRELGEKEQAAVNAVIKRVTTQTVVTDFDE